MITYTVTSTDLAMMLRQTPPMIWDPVAKRWVKVDGFRRGK